MDDEVEVETSVEDLEQQAHKALQAYIAAIYGTTCMGWSLPTSPPISQMLFSASDMSVMETVGIHGPERQSLVI